MANAERTLRQIGDAAIESAERQDWLDPVAERLQRAVTAVYEAGGQTARRIRDALHGTWLGHPLHPVLTDIPLGAWTAAAILDLSRAMAIAVSIGPPTPRSASGWRAPSARPSRG